MIHFYSRIFSFIIFLNFTLLGYSQISEMPQTRFMTLMKDKGLDDTTLLQVHVNAQQARVRNEHALMSLKEAGQGTGVALIDNSLNTPTATSTAPITSELPSLVLVCPSN